ncbi:MAG: ribonuclease HII [Candidatus Pacebacteria bacterium]|nr:ribonuclease HII [Candidatus Paceibacterota bacterium]
MENHYIIGIDEVGRGPIAGPVMVGAFIFLVPDFEKNIKEYSVENKLPLRDSKKLTQKQKEKWVKYFKEEKEKGNCDFAVSSVSAGDIDKIGIVPSIQKALNNSLSRITAQEILLARSSDEGGRGARPSQEVSPASFHIYLDGGLKAPVEYVNQETIIKGDELHPVISCASIVAKVTRDSLMDKYGLEYVDYGFENHAGYGTSAHYAAIKKHGLTPLHRKTFLKNIK